MIAGIDTVSFGIGFGLAIILFGLLFIIFRKKKSKVDISGLMAILQDTSDRLHKAHENINEVYEVLNKANG